MSIPIDHHFVPKTYLKRFTNSENFFWNLTLNYSTIQYKYPTEVCYKKYYFKLQSQDNWILPKINDPNIIEKLAFEKQENEYEKLLEKIIIVQPNSGIEKSEALLFLETLVSIKRRNPTYREKVIPIFKEAINSIDFKELKLPEEISQRINNIVSVKSYGNYIKDSLNSDEIQNDIYLQSFFNNLSISTAELLIKYKLFLYRAPYGSEFITSDNPGFTLINDNLLLSFGGFGFPFILIFPITPQYCLYIDNSYPDNNYSCPTKDISIITIDKQKLDRINSYTYKLAIERVFSLSKTTLLDIVV